MTMFTYLSPEWQEAAAAISGRFSARAGAPEVALVANVTVTGAPFTPEQLELHSLPGIPNVFEPGHVDGAEVSLTIGYQLARLILLDQGTNILELGLNSGEITVDGDTDRLTAYWRTHIGDDAYVALMDELRAITK